MFENLASECDEPNSETLMPMFLTIVKFSKKHRYVIMKIVNEKLNFLLILIDSDLSFCLLIYFNTVNFCLALLVEFVKGTDDSLTDILKV